MLLPQSATFHCLPLREQAKQQLCTLISSVFHHVVASVASVGVSLPLHSQRVYVNLHNAWNSLNKIVESTKLRASLWVEWTSFLQVIASAGIHCSMHTLFDKKARPCHAIWMITGSISVVTCALSSAAICWKEIGTHLQLKQFETTAEGNMWLYVSDWVRHGGIQNAYTYYIYIYT